jgi:asparagine synthase (glutamine-hydrolysing)
MCGIAGFSGNFDRPLLQRMSQTIAHRGPDDDGIFYKHDKSIGLAHRRLSIIDISPLGHQPMSDADGTVVIVYNGEIYNYKALRDELIKSGIHFKSHSDTEVLIYLYLRDGIEMLSRLNGIFAFALWDKRDNSLFLARDGVGVKPLYYSEIKQGFIFASELKALLQESSIDRGLNPLAIHYYLTYLWAPAPHTMLRAVQKLEPGHALLVREGQIQRQWQFYDLPYTQTTDALPLNQAIEQVQYHIKQAVERQMVADVPVGAFLSGGLDSSAVAAFAQRALPDTKLQCFTIGFSEKAAKTEGMIEDWPYAQKVAQHLGVELHTIYVDSEMANHVERMVYQLDEPQADPAPLNALFISQLAREHGIKVLLSGAGGDDIFTGYRRHYALMQERYWAWLPKFVRKGISATAQLMPITHPWQRRLVKAFQYAALDGSERLASYFFWIQPRFLQSLYSADMRMQLALENQAQPLMSALTQLPEKVHPLNRMLYLEGKHFLADHNLNYTDKMSMATGVEVRVPLLDPDLISLATRLPIDYKQHGRVGKWIFKQAMEAYLPKDVIYRPKTGFGAPLRHWLKYELSSLVEDILSKASLEKRGLFDFHGVHQLV